MKTKKYRCINKQCGIWLIWRICRNRFRKRNNYDKYKYNSCADINKTIFKRHDKKDKGNILNVASIAGFMPGPLMATYYATKNYVVALTRAVRIELKKKKSNVKISLLCPGPVDTNFNKVANVKFKIPGLSSEKVAQYAIDKMLKINL